MIMDCLTQAGYTNIIPTTDGQEAWEILKKYKAAGTLKDSVACVLTDIEMPRMDGHHLTKLIKDDEEMSHIPVIIFSSLVNDQMRMKGRALGADAQLSKPEIGKLVEEMDRLIGDRAQKESE
jgi:two-component system chemotaxis response regulator CheV